MELIKEIGVVIMAGLTAISGLFSTQPETILGANQKISELTTLSSPLVGDVLPINDTANATTKKITLGSLFNYLVSTTTYTSTVQSPLIKLGSGSEIAPTLTFTNDTGLNTGLFLDAQNTLGLVAGGTAIVFSDTVFKPESDLTLDLGSASQRWVGFHAINATTTAATTTSFYVSSLASTTQVRANTGTIGAATVGNLTVTGACTGCSAANTVNIYAATTTAGRYMAKTLNLVAGDMVIWIGSMSEGVTNFGSMSYRISSPWNVATTTVISNTSANDDVKTGQGVFLATTTSTVTFDYTPGGSASLTSMTIWVANGSFSNTF